MTEPNHRHLVEAFLADRDEAAFRQLYRSCTPQVYLLVKRLCGSSDPNAEDLVHETWVRAVARLARFRWRSNLQTWLNGIAINCYREYIRSRKREREHIKTTDPPQSVHPRGKIDLERVLGELPGKYREVIVLHDIEGYSHKEIAALLGLAEGASKSRLSRARAAARARLRSQGG